MKISLIVATKGRTTELQRLLESLVQQDYPDLEVILVDQNLDDRISLVINAFTNRLEIIYQTSAQGATRARNVGLSVARGDIIGFPDDDCWYPTGVLRRVSSFLAVSQEWDGIIGHTVDGNGVATLPWKDAPGRLSAPMSWRRSVTYVYFLRRSAAHSVGGFDELLGPGAGTPWGAGDDNDFMLRALKKGAKVYFDPSLAICHPPLFLGFDTISLDKRERYARADGRILRKHPMPLWWTVAFFCVPIARSLHSILSLNWESLRFHWVTFLGRLRGFRDREFL